MPGEKGDVGDIVSDRRHLLLPTRMTSSIGLDALTCLSPFTRAASVIRVLLGTVE